jgi:hypothetical protein
MHFAAAPRPRTRRPVVGPLSVPEIGSAAVDHLRPATWHAGCANRAELGTIIHRTGARSSPATCRGNGYAGEAIEASSLALRRLQDSATAGPHPTRASPSATRPRDPGGRPGQCLSASNLGRRLAPAACVRASGAAARSERASSAVRANPGPAAGAREARASRTDLRAPPLRRPPSGPTSPRPMRAHPCHHQYREDRAEHLPKHKVPRMFYRRRRLRCGDREAPTAPNEA